MHTRDVLSEKLSTSYSGIFGVLLPHGYNIERVLAFAQSKVIDRSIAQQVAPIRKVDICIWHRSGIDSRVVHLYVDGELQRRLCCIKNTKACGSRTKCCDIRKTYSTQKIKNGTQKREWRSAMLMYKLPVQPKTPNKQA